jgi:hypothetical protein
MRQAIDSAAFNSLPFHDSPPLAGLFASDDDADLAQTMADRIVAFAPASDAEALALLRAAFPAASLRQRVAALRFLTRSQRRQPYNPR